MMKRPYSFEHEGPNHQKTPDFSGARLVAPAFRLRHPEAEDVMVEGVRYVAWQGNDDDGSQIADLAGWARMEHGQTPDGLRYIVVPEGTRSAASVLSGTEAWQGEKLDLLRRFSGLVAEIVAETHMVDVTATLNTIGVTRDTERTEFIAPPHLLMDDPVIVNEWKTDLIHDAEHVLAADPQAEALVSEFAEMIEQAVTPGEA